MHFVALGDTNCPVANATLGGWVSPSQMMEARLSLPLSLSVSIVQKGLVLGVPVASIALCLFSLLPRKGGRAGNVGETRCRKCSYILRGISEPRCPECGERI